MHFVENCFFAGEDDRGEWTHVRADVCLSESCAAFWGWWWWWWTGRRGHEILLMIWLIGCEIELGCSETDRQSVSQSDNGRSWRRSFLRRRRCAMASPTCCQPRIRRTHLGKKKMLQSLSLHGAALLRGATRVRVLIVPAPVTVRSPCLDVEVFLCPSFWSSGIAEMVRTGSNFCFEFFAVCVNTRLLFAVGCPVGWSSWGIPCTTKDPHSQKRSGIVTTCAAFCHPQLFLRNSRSNSFYTVVALESLLHSRTQTESFTLWSSTPMEVYPVCHSFSINWSDGCGTDPVTVCKMTWSSWWQVERILHNVRSYENPLEKYVAVMDLQVQILELQILLAWHCLHLSIFASVLAFLLILQIYLSCSCSESTLNPNPNLTLILLYWPQANGSGLPGMWYCGISHEDLVCLFACFLFVIRKGMRDCSTRCWSIMWRSSCQLCIHPL